MAVFKGAGVAIVTPFFADGSVNYDKLTEILEEQVAAGTDAVIICGTTGEKSTLNYEEHVRVIETAAKANAGRVPLIAGTGSNDTVYSAGLCEDAAPFEIYEIDNRDTVREEEFLTRVELRIG
mgnify:CR=1 FL=1